MTVTIKEIAYTSEEYEKEIALRDKILRKPLGLKFTDEFLSQDKYNIHFAAYIKNEMVGCLLLHPLSREVVQMRQVAVDETHQSKGIGNQLVLYSEMYARKMGFSEMILHAREYAVPFYKKLGYRISSDVFTEVNIPHYEMKKYL